MPVTLPVTTPYALAAEQLERIINDEWSVEGYTARHDNLHAAVGLEGTRIGIAPEDETAAPGKMVQNNLRITVKFYTRWQDEADPNMRVDPRKIALHAERFRRAVQKATDLSLTGLWFFNIDRIRYPNDPTGNKTRFEADITAYGQNSGLVETTG